MSHDRTVQREPAPVRRRKRPADNRLGHSTPGTDLAFPPTVILADLRFALRSLARVPVLALAAIGSLTLGLATAAVVFSLVNAAVLRPPPFEAADRLAVLNITQRTPAEGLFRQRWSWPRFQRLAQGVTSFERVGSSTNAVLTLTGDGPPEPVPTEFVSSGYLAVLRAPITLGRAFGTEADRPGADPSVILGQDLWRRRFGADSGVLGRVVQLNGVALTADDVRYDFTATPAEPSWWRVDTRHPA